MIDACRGQLRVGGMGQPFALDFGAVMTVGAALGVDPRLLVDVLPSIEGVIVGALADDAGDSECPDPA